MDIKSRDRPIWMYLSDADSEFTVIRTAFETLRLLSDDAPLCEELRQLIEEVRMRLTHRLRDVYARLKSDPDITYDTTYSIFKFDYALFQQQALEMMQQGYPVAQRFRQTGNLPLNFDEAEQPLFYFSLAGGPDIESLKQTDSISFFLLLLKDVCDSAFQSAHYSNNQQFDREVYQKYVAFQWLLTEAFIRNPEMLYKRMCCHKA